MLGRPLVDRVRADGSVTRAVAGFDATLSAPKSVSVWWALTGDDRVAQCHDVAVRAVADHLERYGATTRIRAGDGRVLPDTEGLTMAAFRQTTSRLGHYRAPLKGRYRVLRPDREDGLARRC